MSHSLSSSAVVLGGWQQPSYISGQSTACFQGRASCSGHRPDFTMSGFSITLSASLIAGRCIPRGTCN